MKIIDIVHSDDGATRFLLETHDRHRVESVFLNLDHVNKDSICISSQVGCALGCTFCSTGLLGLRRNLEAGEIVEQVSLCLDALNFEQERRFDVSFMGMGEPLQNLGAVITARSQLLKVFPNFRFFLSTVGLVPKIRQLAAREPSFGLQISLHASTDEVRRSVLPIASRYSIAEVLDAAENYAQASDSIVSLNYCLVRGVNDGIEQAELLPKLALNRPFRVQIVNMNPHESLSGHPASQERVELFLRKLREAGITSQYGQQLGQDIGGGCGQLDADYRRHELSAR